MKVVKLGDIACFNPENLKKSTAGEYEIKYIDIESVNVGKINAYKDFAFKDAPSRARRIVKSNDILISTVRPYLKAFAKVEDDYGNIICSTGFAVMRVNEGISSDYVFSYLMSDLFINQLIPKMVGANYPAVSAEDIKECSISLPAYKEQLKIASALAEADTLIQKRKEAIAKLDGLVQSVYDDMFGDYRLNNKDWLVNTLNEVVVDITAGWSVGGEERPKAPTEMAVLKISSVTSGTFNSAQYKVVDPKLLLSRALVHPLKDDILFSRANTRELVGATCMVDADYYDLFLPDKLWKINVSDKCNPYYFLAVVKNRWFREKLSSKATGTSGSMLNISKSKFLEMEIQMPPKQLQDRYGKIAENIQNQKKQMQRQLAKLEENFQSLLHQAFTGRLQFRD
ncbi:restriction endonuclease subunit S [Paenibacillus sp. ACRSA]|uniref:restriction endonuclease subunit S n=1 Tax=Paenibacillus sp. ACRSA TaxID=2918211 RepID=UPI001EF48722|nr:restriction endonuclease subunit S [Paenibacillus sp. ACRSA]MCG7377372.1 restriction endonuclease subunit S [Paenibacillus sp. ACRSA]